MLDASAKAIGLAFAATAIEGILLRGPALTAWLYDNRPVRTSADIDVLVSFARLAEARACLLQLGLRRLLDTTPGAAPEHAEVWLGSTGIPIDLHWTVIGAEASPAAVWDTLRAESAPLVTNVQPLLVPRASARALLVGLHAGQHGIGSERTLRDLESALDRLDHETWREATSLAYRIDAVDLFSAGLRLNVRGASVADALALPATMSKRTALRVGGRGDTPTATGFARLEEARTMGMKARLLWHKFFPPAKFVCDSYPYARRSKGALLSAYIYRILWLLRWAPCGYFAWRKAKAASKASDQR